MQDSLVCDKERYSDNWETPPEFYEHVLPLVQGQAIWEPFVGVTHRSTKAMQNLGLDVLETPDDFFERIEKHWPIKNGKPRLLLSNPPFSLKFKVLEALIRANRKHVRPFILLLPGWVVSSATFRHMVKDTGFKPQIFVPTIRLNYYSPKDFKQKKRTAFDSMCICYGMNNELWKTDVLYY